MGQKPDMASVLVSTIMPVYNEAQFLSEAIDSILSQTHNHVELLIVDDHSSDNSVEIAQSYARGHQNIHVLQNPQKGKVSAFNTGMGAASGDYVHLFAGDDILDSGCFEKCLAAISCLNVNVLYHDMLLVESDLSPLRPMQMGDRFPELSLYNMISQSVSLPSGAWFFARNASPLAWPVPDEIPFEDMWLTFCFKAQARIGYVAEPLYYYRQHAQQTYGRMNDFSLERFLYRRRRYAKTIRYLLTAERVKGYVDASVRQALVDKLFFLEMLDAEHHNFSRLFQAHLSILQKGTVAALWYWPSLLTLALQMKSRLPDNLSEKRWFYRV